MSKIKNIEPTDNGNGKFEDQKTITSILFYEDYIVNVGERSFKGCTSLEKINTNNKIKTIGSNAFFNCIKLYGDIDKCDDSSCKGCDKCNTKVLKLSHCDYIGYGAFANCEKLSNIFFCEEDNVEIGSFKFEDSDLDSDLETYGAFENCISLKKINEDNKIEKIGTKAFSNCVNLSNINISNCIEIGDYAFANCSMLSEITLSENTGITIGEYTFENCESLKNINKNNKIEKIGAKAFSNCVNLSDITLQNCIEISDYAFNGCKSLSKITLDVCNKLDITAFNDCEKLTKVYMYTKDGCELTNYKDITYEEYVINYNFYVTYDSIVKYKTENPIWQNYIKQGKVLVVAGDNNYIYKTNNNKKIDLSSNYNNNFDSDFNFGSLSFDYIIENVNPIFKRNRELTYIDIPSKAIRIIESAFENCINLKEINLPNTLKYIEDYAFKNCTSLSEGLTTPIILPESLEELEEGIFAGCKNINKFEGKFVTSDGIAIVYNNKLINVAPKNISKNVNILGIDKNIKRLGKYCFSECEKINTVYIPENILSIGNYAFENCTNLKHIYIYGNPPILGIKVFENINKDFQIYVDEDKVELYKLVYENEGYADKIKKREL